MPRLPLPLRVAAGLAATTVQEVRALPSTLVSLPVTAVSQVLQTFMRAQQHITSLAIKGDEVLGLLSPGEESPPWATFDDDEPAPPARQARSSGRFALYSQVPDDHAEAPTPLDAARQAKAAAVAEAAPAAPLPGYDTMTLAQLRARLRQLSLVELEDLLLHERAGQARAPFLTMLSNRIASVRAQ